MVAASGPKLLENTSDFIFFEKPSQITVNEEFVSDYATSQKIETLMKDLQKGPMIAVGRIGPSSYVEKPFKLKDAVFKQEIYGWKKGDIRRNFPEKESLIVLGARKNDGREYVYFTLSEDKTKDEETYIRKHIPSSADAKIYVVSHETFRRYLIDLYPTAVSLSSSKVEGDEKVTSSTKTPVTKMPEEFKESDYVKKLSEIKPLDSILDRGVGEANCKAIGQEIFDKFKKKAGGDSCAGKEALQRIVETIRKTATDGKLRVQHIDRAWNGVGDSTWFWMA